MNDFSSICFVCGISVNKESTEKNNELNLPVCNNCKGTDKEKMAVSNLTDDLAEGFVCGCI